MEFKILFKISLFCAIFSCFLLFIIFIKIQPKEIEIKELQNLTLAYVKISGKIKYNYLESNNHRVNLSGLYGKYFLE